MRYRIKDYTITGTTSIQVNDVFTKEDVRLIVNETQKVVIGSSMKKDKFDVYSANGISTITFDGALCQLQSTDQLTIEIDNGDTLTQVQSKVDEVGNKIDNIKLPEIDTTNIASKDLERFFGVKPIEGYEFMTAEEICAELEEIMTSMDLDLTPEKAKEITQQTLNN